jgi:predicted nucleic acid-binding protein
LQFERLAFDANAAIDSLRPARPFPLPLNHLWIAALCLQFDLPLLTNDALFDEVSELEVIHW